MALRLTVDSPRLIERGWMNMVNGAASHSAIRDVDDLACSIYVSACHCQEGSKALFKVADQVRLRQNWPETVSRWPDTLATVRARLG